MIYRWLSDDRKVILYYEFEHAARHWLYVHGGSVEKLVYGNWVII